MKKIAPVLCVLALALGCQKQSSSPLSPRFNHVYLVVADLDLSIDFYTTAFDLQVTKRIQSLKRIDAEGTVQEFEVKMALLKFPGQDFVLEISERDGFHAVNDSSSYAHVGIDVLDIEVAEARILAAGATVITGITTVQADDIEAKNSFYLGPDGEIVELMQLVRGVY